MNINVIHYLSLRLKLDDVVKDKDFEQLLTKENVYFHDLDLSSESSYDALKMNYYDVIYHLAAINGTSNFYDIPARVLKVCTYSTKASELIEENLIDFKTLEEKYHWQDIKDLLDVLPYNLCKGYPPSN